MNERERHEILIKSVAKTYDAKVLEFKRVNERKVKVGVINDRTAITYLNVNHIQHTVKDGVIYVTASIEKIIEINRALVHLECGVYLLEEVEQEEERMLM